METGQERNKEMWGNKGEKDDNRENERKDKQEDAEDNTWEEEMDTGGLVCPRRLRRSVVLGGIILIFFGGVLIWNGVRRQSSTQEEVLASYAVQTTSHARVHLLQNNLYPEPWLEAGAVCAGSLTDYIELTFLAEASVEESAGEQIAEDGQSAAYEQTAADRQTAAYEQTAADRQTAADGQTSADGQSAADKQAAENGQKQGEKQVSEVTGSGTVSAVLSGYQASGDSKKTVYEQNQILQEQTGKEKLEFTVQIRPSDYLTRAQEADQILGGSVSKALTLQFQGSFQILAAGEEKEQSFSCQVEIPLVSPGGFYEITLPETEVQKGEITETKTRVLPVRWKGAAAGIGGILSGLFLIWFVIWLTREPDETELWEHRMRRLLKKYGSQLFAVEAMPETTGKSVIRLQSIESLLQVSEDRNVPVLYVAAENGLPAEGRFLVFGTELCCEVRFEPES